MVITDRQREVLEFIQEYTQIAGRPPTVRVIGDCLGISSPNGVVCHLNALEKNGFIERDRRKACGIRVVEREQVKTIWGIVEIGAQAF